MAGLLDVGPQKADTHLGPAGAGGSGSFCALDAGPDPAGLAAGHQPGFERRTRQVRVEQSHLEPCRTQLAHAY